MVGVNMENGLDAGTFREIVTEMVQQRAAIRNIYEVAGAIEFEYTYWAKPDNKSAVRQNLIDVSKQIKAVFIVTKELQCTVPFSSVYSCSISGPPI